MNCEAFQAKIDAYMDSELTLEERAEMEEHARGCMECGLLLDRATSLATMCAEMDEGLVVPLGAQAAWRQAVRAEAEKKRKKRGALGDWTRGLAAVAAAMVVLITGTYGMRGVEPVSGSPRPEAEGNLASVEAAGRSEDGLMPRMTSGGTLLRSDGTGDGVDQVDQRSDSVEGADLGGSILVRSATREIHSEGYEEDCVWLENLVSEYDAYFEERSETFAGKNGARTLSATVCVPYDRLDEFLMEMDQLGRTVARSETAQDITGKYLDMQARRDALSAQQERLMSLRENAQTLEDTLTIEREIAEVQAQLDSLRGEGQARTDYSKVTLTMSETTEAEPTQASSDLAGRMREEFDESVQWLGQFGQNALVALAFAAPRMVVWIPALVLAVVLLRVIFRRRK